MDDEDDDMDKLPRDAVDDEDEVCPMGQVRLASRLAASGKSAR